jgi:hypothetical protein
MLPIDTQAKRKILYDPTRLQCPQNKIPVPELGHVTAEATQAPEAFHPDGARRDLEPAPPAKCASYTLGITFDQHLSFNAEVFSGSYLPGFIENVVARRQTNHIVPGDCRFFREYVNPFRFGDVIRVQDQKPLDVARQTSDSTIYGGPFPLVRFTAQNDEWDDTSPGRLRGLHGSVR